MSLGHLPLRATATNSSSPARREGRGEGVGNKKRPPSGSFPRVLEGRRGKAPGGIKGRAECQSESVRPWRSRSCAEVWSLEPAAGGESGHRGGDTSWGRGEACCAIVWIKPVVRSRTRPELRGHVRDVEREPERLRSKGARPVGPCLTVGRWRGDVEGHTTSHHEGGGNLRGLLEFLRSTKLLGHKDPKGSRLPPCL